jgi:spore maturation protein SpmA
MKTVLKVSSVLTWFNLIIWGFIAAMGILAAMMAGNFSFLLVTFLTGVTVLHSYASLKLHKSIRYSNVPLSDQTPVGIRFIGFIALFFGVLYIGDGIGLLKSTADIVKLMAPQLPPEVKNMDLIRLFRGIGIFSLITGLSISVNVFLNFRLLRWYYLVKQSDIS